MKLNTSPVTSVQAPHSSRPARSLSVRGARRVTQRPAHQRISAAGSSQEISRPISSVNSRRMPVSPPKEAVPPPPPPRRRCRNRRAAGRCRCSPAPAPAASSSSSRRCTAAVGSGPQLDQRHEPARRDDHRGQRGEQLQQPRPQPGRAGHQVDEPQRGHDQQGLPHLREEPEADRSAGSDQPPRRRPRGCRVDGPDHGVPGRDEQQHQQRIGVVEAEHQHGGRGQGQRRAGERAPPPVRPSASPPRTATRPPRRPPAPAAPAGSRS